MKNLTKIQIIAIIFIVIYFASPLDFVPDAIPILGGMDDLLVTAFFLWSSGLMEHLNDEEENDDIKEVIDIIQDAEQAYTIRR